MTSQPARAMWLATLDPGIALYVDVLDAAGVETFESCEGGDGHAFSEPTVRFHGERGEGFRALSIALTHRLPVGDLRRYWQIYDGEPCGPRWEMTFRTLAERSGCTYPGCTSQEAFRGLCSAHHERTLDLRAETEDDER